MSDIKIGDKFIIELVEHDKDRLAEYFKDKSGVWFNVDALEKFERCDEDAESNMIEIELIKACPFCGAFPEVLMRYRNGVANRKMYWLRCTACGVEQAHHDMAGYQTRKKAVRAWNRRAKNV